MTMNVQSESVELPLKWESRNHVLQVADGFPTKNRNTDATIVKFKPIGATIKFENPPTETRKKWSWKFEQDATDDNGYIGYSWSSPIGYEDKEFYEADGFGKGTKVIVTLSMSQNVNKEGSWWANVVEIVKAPEEAKKSIPEAVKDIPKKQSAIVDSETGEQEDPNALKNKLKEAYENQIGKTGLLGVPLDDSADHVFDTQQRIAISVGYNNLTVLYSAIVSNLKEVLDSDLYSLDDLKEIKDILHESYKLSSRGNSAYLTLDIQKEISGEGI
jgi:hypothetical protein